MSKQETISKPLFEDFEVEINNVKYCFAWNPLFVKNMLDQKDKQKEE